MKILKTITLVSCVLITFCATAADSLEKNFHHPPANARPWVYWFWNNGNVTSNGITADLEAMQRAGLGGVLIMDVVQPFAPPRGTAEFMNAEWQNLFQFSVQEAARLGLEINMANGPGWCGSSGPWITPELSMQTLVSTKTDVTGPTTFSEVLPVPNTGKKEHDGLNNSVKYDTFYRDLAVLAFPETTNEFIPSEAVTNLTGRMDADGRLTWDVPPGRWFIQRLGHTTTGSTTRPPVVGGNGLECDKLSFGAMGVQFTNMMGRLVQRAGPLTGKSLVATHIDSWEVGSQDWTSAFREEFEKRRGYDPLPWLPCLINGSKMAANAAMADRFRWDFSQTRAELLAENYSGGLARLAHEHGLRYTLEGYDLPFGDEATYTARADEPMTEFWTNPNPHNANKGVQMASVGHVYGRRIIGAEAFTSSSDEKWMRYPATIKAQGDFEFSQGINRFVFHRYAHQPYLDRFPGSTMGPWGLHYERTQTWWNMVRPWHEYLARCQFLLRQGLFVADLCYLRPELPNQTYFNPVPAVPPGCKYDEMSAEALLDRVTVKNGRLVLPDGMSYQLLVLPPTTTMTPALAAKIKQLVSDGASILVNGPAPQTSPSLDGYPQCDTQVAQLTDEIWGDGNDQNGTEHSLGQGRVFRGSPLTNILAQLGAPPDFATDVKLNWIHRHTAEAEIYFVANPAAISIEAACHFRMSGLAPEEWNPMTGETTPLAVYEITAKETSIPLHLDPSGSTFVIFRRPAQTLDSVVSFTRDGESVFPTMQQETIHIQTATYGVPGDAGRTRDRRATLQTLVDQGVTSLKVADLARGDDPAYDVVKTVVVSYTAGGRTGTITGQDPDTISLIPALPAPERAAEVNRAANGHWRILARQPGIYELKTASGQTLEAEITDVPAPLDITGPWTLTFPPKWGAPDHTVLDSLASWTDSTIAGVKYFSGTATYTKTFDWPARIGKEEAWLDLGDVKVMARVKLNGHDLGVWWKPPFRANITRALHPGKNTLEIQVANLWPNRMIGDSALAETNRVTWSSWEPFNRKTPLLKSGLLGPVVISTLVSSQP